MADKTYQTTLLIRGDSKDAVKSVQLTRDELEKLTGAQKKTETMTGRLTSAWNKANDATVRHSGNLKILGAAAVGGIAVALKSIIDYSDRYKQLQGQLALVTSSQDELNAVWDRSLALSNETGASIDSTVNLYARMARSTEELGLSQEELFTITKAINQSFIVSGASAQEADSAILQLSQGMASGVLRGEELNSVMENSPRLARALADGLGVGIGKLREMGANGELTADAVTSALLRMSDSIDTEFDRMPMTVARATNEISNLLADAFGKADLSPIVSSVQDLANVLKDPAIMDGLTNMASALVRVATGAAQALAELQGLTVFLAESLASGAGVAADDLDRMASRIEYLKTQTAQYAEAGERVPPMVREQLAELKELESVYALMLELTTSSTKAKGEEAVATEQLSEITVEATRITADYSKATTALLAAHKSQQAQIEKNAKSFEAANKELGGMVRKTEEYIKQLEFEEEQTTRTAREQAIENDVRAAGTRITAEQEARIRALSAAKYDAESASKSLADAEQEAARASEQAWSSARNTLSNFFFEMAADGKNAFDTLVDGFRAMISKMIAEAAANRILLAVGVGGASGTASASTAGGGAASAVSGGSSLLSSFSGGFASTGQSFYEGAGTFLSNNGMTGLGDMAYTKGLNTTGLTMGLDIGGGIVGSLAANKVFGETSGIGSGVGAVAGSILIPIPGLGAAIGSFVGAGIEKGLSKLFGEKNDGANRGAASFSLSTGVVTGEGIGKSFDAENVSAAEALASSLTQFADAIGGSNLTGRILVGNKNGIEYDGRTYGDDSSAFLRDAFRDAVKSATELDARLKPIILGLDGTATEIADLAQVLYAIDQASGGVNNQMVTLLKNFKGGAAELAQFSAAVLSLQDSSGVNAVTQAVKDFNAQQKSAARYYAEQTTQLRRQISLFDGSAESASRMAQMLNDNKIAAYNFATAIKSIGKSLDEVAESQARSIRESVMSDQALLEKRIAERDYMISALSMITDPNTLSEVGQKILATNQEAFNSLSESQKLLQAESYAQVAESTNATIQAGLQNFVGGLSATQDELNARVMSAMAASAGDHKTAAATQVKAANMMNRAAELIGAAIGMSAFGREVTA